MTGTVSARYTLGESKITGTAQSALNFPAGSGSLVYVNSGNASFDISSTNVKVLGSGGGRLLDRYVFSGEYNLSGPPSDLSTFGGQLSVRFNYKSGFYYRHPSNFDPNVGSGFGFNINSRYKMDGNSTIILSNSDFSGEMSVNLAGSATGIIRFPSFLWMGGGTSGYNAAMSCTGTLRKPPSNSLLYFSGSIKLSYNGYSGSASVSDLPLP